MAPPGSSLSTVQLRLAFSSVIRKFTSAQWRRAFSTSAASPSSSFAANVGESKNNMESKNDATDEFWVVEGEILRIKSDHLPKNKLKMTIRSPPNENLNLSRKKVAQIRNDRVMAARISKSERGQEDYWRTYTKRYQSVQDEWEKLYWDEVPEMKHVPLTVDKNDHFTILGLKRRDKPYTPVELKSAYREMALKYHPDHNPGKDAEIRFDKIWNAYKMLQHKRSWR